MEASLAFQKALAARLKGGDGVSVAVRKLVPHENISDRQGLPSRFPSVNIGEAQTVPPGLDWDRTFMRVYSTVHVWARDGALVEAKQIAGAIGEALRPALGLVDGYRVVDLEMDARFLRDPDGMTGHGVVTVEALLQEAT